VPPADKRWNDISPSAGHVKGCLKRWTCNIWTWWHFFQCHRLHLSWLHQVKTFIPDFIYIIIFFKKYIAHYYFVLVYVLDMMYLQV